MTGAVARGARWQVCLLLLGIGLVGVLVHAAGPAAVFQAFRSLGWLTPLVVLPYLSSYVLDTIGWWWVLSRGIAPAAGCGGAAPSLPRMFAVRAAGEAVNAITPTAYFGGEPVKAWLLHRRGVPLAPGMASVLISKTALMLTQGLFVLLGALIALQRWQSAIPLWAAASIGLLLACLVGTLFIGLQRIGLFTVLLNLSRRVSGREALLAEWESDVAALDELLRRFYAERVGTFLGCCALHFLGWVAGALEVLLAVRWMGIAVDFPAAFSIEALSGVAKLAAVIVPGSLGIQEGGQVLIFVAFGFSAPLAMTFSLLRRGREILWIGFGASVLIHQHAMRWLRERETARRAGDARPGGA